MPHRIPPKHGIDTPSQGPAGTATILDRDTRLTLVALLARGQSPEEIAYKTGAPLNLIQSLQAHATEEMNRATKPE